MKTERVTLLTSPEFKSFLTKEARSEGISVAELVRSRCEGCGLNLKTAVEIHD